MYLKGGSTAGIATVTSMPVPPATYYGPVPTDLGVPPEPGMTVNAWIDANLCGQDETQNIGGEIWFSIDVLADDFGAAAGCGAPGREVAFEVEPLGIVYTAVWNNDCVWPLPLERFSCR